LKKKATIVRTNANETKLKVSLFSDNLNKISKEVEPKAR
jgi:hypothetical protein